MSAGGCAFLSAERIEKDQECVLNFKLDNTFEMKDVKAVAPSILRHRIITNFRAGFLFTSLTEKFRENLFTKLFDIQRAQKQENVEIRERIRKLHLKR